MKVHSQLLKLVALAVLASAASCDRSDAQGAGGCARDSDCKGDRICVNQHCEPPATAVSAAVSSIPAVSLSAPLSMPLPKHRKAMSELEQLAGWRGAISTNPTVKGDAKAGALQWLDAEANRFRNVTEATPDAEFAVLLYEVQIFAREWFPSSPKDAREQAPVDGWDCFQECLSCSGSCGAADGGLAGCADACTQSSGACCERFGRARPGSLECACR